MVSALGRQGLIQWPGFSVYGLSGIVLAHTFMNAPWVMMQCRAQWRYIPIQQQRIAQNLSLGPWAQFVWLFWPRIRALLWGQWWLVFALCFTSFAVVLVFGGTRWATLEVAVFQAIRLDFDLAQAVAIALVQVLCLLPMLWVMRGTIESGFETAPGAHSYLPASGLTGCG